ncbi:MAG: bifunctional (p)ppGpp synthetase/guanosine-3',5'-bis(diphosphate) 3'-pyrophosphohydrolase [Coriobacteriia bacterium]|jgi:GTP pyrophosphokinase|nr:bifunctional (p)ppGpp synthetase/guanosine-3',5'-bis(diphosphate) 3'-pyrophosphohydrolase [Coriobacteriia bacterium]MDR2714912.1 bifunctional (p)ppGpp synthetase/guanosine-3',5'-bis(diphosphate) 3'-pyrophosphohydrolase [Coriobacteriales bacterium]
MSEKPIQKELEQEEQSILDKILNQAASYMGKPEIALLNKAYEFALSAHEGQTRKSGEPFINHPLAVALILAELRMDIDTVVAAILHDTVEDSSKTIEEVGEVFSDDVMTLVDGVTKITRIEIESLSEQQANNMRKMLLAMSRDIRVIVIKLADRLHNMRTLQALREDRRLFKAQETMEIYAPLANRLGINSIKWELEDLSFYYLEPVRFSQIQRMVAESRSAREEYLEKTINELNAEMDKLNIRAKITGRPKHLYSIHQKMVEKGKDFSEIYDLIALRVIVETIGECYSCLGAVHTIWRPMPGRFKDYIAMPKFNMYQSLHTTVIGLAARPLEIQIRTKDMHHTSEYGVAAHWRYKGGKSESFDAVFDEQLVWLRQMLDWADDEADSREFLEAFKHDLNYTEVFCFTPKGEVINLRTGSTAIDFAYAIHTEVGNRCVGAKVNGAIMPLSYELQTGDRVEILTQKGTGPSRDWLPIVKTPSARQKIRSYFSKMTRDDDILSGRDVLTREMRKHGLGIASTRSTRALKEVADELSAGTVDDLFAHIGAGKQSAKQVANRMLRVLGTQEETDTTNVEKIAGIANLDAQVLEPVRDKRPRAKTDASGVVVKGLDGVLVRLSHCCNPVPGDEIIGFVTRGRGVSVHRANCPNAQDLRSTPERIIDVHWAEDHRPVGAYNVEVFIEAVDRLRLLQDVITTLANSGVNVIGASSNSHRDGFVEMRFLYEVSEIASIDRILSDLRAIEGVIDARRMLPGEVMRKRKD